MSRNEINYVTKKGRKWKAEYQGRGCVSFFVERVEKEGEFFPGSGWYRAIRWYDVPVVIRKWAVRVFGERGVKVEHLVSPCSYPIKMLS
jgi:hypothetical protein